MKKSSKKRSQNIMSGEIFFLILHSESNKKGKLFQIKKIKS